MAVKVTVVNRQNLKDEFVRIRKCLQKGSYVAVDTEYPGTVIQLEKPYYQRNLEENYDFMRKNVNNTKLIQLGLTVCDNRMEPVEVWEFNFNEFDLAKDRQNKNSIDLLKSYGFDFVTNRKEGVSEAEFAEEFKGSGLMAGSGLDLKWVFFHCTDDLGYLIKILTQEITGQLPESLGEFMRLVRKLLGGNVFDVKPMVADELGWYFGLEKVAQNLNLTRTVGRRHQAGSDSLLTLHCFRKVVEDRLVPKYYGNREYALQYWSYNLHGLTSLNVPPRDHVNPQPAVLYPEPCVPNYYPYPVEQDPIIFLPTVNYILLA